MVHPAPGHPGTSAWGDGVDASLAAFPAANLTGTVNAARLPASARAAFTIADSGLFVSTTGNDADDGLSPGAAKATVAAAAAALPSGQGQLNIAAGVHTANGIPLTTGLRVQGFGRGASTLTSTGDVFTLSSGGVGNVAIHGISIWAGGSAFKISGSGMLAESTIEDCYLLQTTGTAPIIDACGLIDTTWRISVEGHASASTPLIRLIAAVGNVDAIAGNSFTGRSTHSSSYVFHIEDATGVSTVENNAIRDFNFEIPNSGAVKILSGNGNILDNTGIYDLTGSITVPLIYVGKSSASTKLSIGNEINVRRYGGSLGSTGYDVQLVAGEASETVLANCWASTGGFKVDWGGYQLATAINIDMWASTNAQYVHGNTTYGTKFIWENPGNLISAEGAGAGVSMVNPATHKLLISDGTNWRDTMGTIV